MEPIFIDTGFIIALINRRDKYHQQSQNLAHRFMSHPLVVTDAVLFEAGNALARQFKPQAIAIMDQFIASDQVQIVYQTPELFAEAFALFKNYQDKTWGLVDCLSFIVMQKRHIRSALTFDKHFAQAGFIVLPLE